LDHTELVKVKARSQNEMKKTLNWWDLMWFSIDVSIFVLTGLEAHGFALRLLLHRIRHGDLM
jgi:APA family basic amino acid/polyamine antiporter